MASEATQSTTSQMVIVESEEDVRGVRLQAAEEPALDGEHGRLLLRHSPDFILYPDARSMTPPFKNGREDYHPRSVEAYFDRAHAYVATPSGLTAGLYAVAMTGGIIVIAACWMLLGLAPPATIAFWLLVAIAVATAAVILVNVFHPISMDGVRKRIDLKEPTARLGVRRFQLDIPFQNPVAFAAWIDYRRNVVDSGKYPRTSYVRALESRGDLYLQYWQFYVFNDWHNRHEADWEVVVVRLVGGPGQWRPLAAAFSSHLGGHWRMWEELECRDGTHPVVYVAKGSHAQYFEPNREGYLTTLSQPLGLLDFKIRLSVQRDWRDRIAGPPRPGSTPYRLVPLPAGADVATWTPTELRDFWWLRFQGDWGKRGAIRGPAIQVDRWSDPWEWINQSVDRDSGFWRMIMVAKP